MANASTNLLQKTHIKAQLSYYLLILTLIFAPSLWHYRLAGDIPLPILPFLVIVALATPIVATFRSNIDKSYPKYVGVIWWAFILLIPAFMWALDISFPKTLQHLAIWTPIFTRIIRRKREEIDYLLYPVGPT